MHLIRYVPILPLVFVAALMSACGTASSEPGTTLATVDPMPARLVDALARDAIVVEPTTVAPGGGDAADVLERFHGLSEPEMFEDAPTVYAVTVSEADEQLLRKGGEYWVVYVPDVRQDVTEPVPPPDADNAEPATTAIDADLFAFFEPEGQHLATVYIAE